MAPGAKNEPKAMQEIWAEAENLFYKKVNKADVNLSEPRRSLKRAVEDLKKEPSGAEKSHGRYKTKTDGNKSASTIKSGGVIDRLEVLLELGDKVMVAAPETVSLVWMGLSTIGRIFIQDSAVLNTIEETTNQMSATILVCEVYAQRYFGGKVEDQFRDTKGSVRSQVPELLALVLRFFYLASKHLKKKAIHRILSSSFGTESKELQTIADDARTKLEGLQKTAQVDFEEFTLKLLKEMKRSPEELARLKKLTKRAFASINADMREIKDKLDDIHNQNSAEEVTKRFSANLKWFKQGHVISLESPIDRYKENISEKRRYKGSCQWILGVRGFSDWAAQSSGVLCLSGQGGVGKSVLVSTIIENFDHATKSAGAVKGGKEGKSEKPLMLYFFCKLGDPHAANSTKIMLHLCAQLFQKAADEAVGDEQDQVAMQKKCNAVIEKAKADLADAERKRPSFMKMSALQSLFKELNKVLGKPLVVIVDALDECSDDNFLHTLEYLASSRLRVRVLVSSREKPAVSRIDVDENLTKPEIRKYVSNALRTAMPHWNRKTRGKATDEVVSYAEGKFKYAASVMERLRKPEAAFMSYSTFTKSLPHGTAGIYRQRIDELNQDSRGILITALRWLICGRDTMEILPVADELSETYTQAASDPDGNGDTGEDDVSEEQFLKNTAKSFAQIGRDFFRVNGTTLQLEHNSVRDFVLSGKDQRTSEAGKEYGHLCMAENLIRTLNSPEFQNKYLSKNSTKERNENDSGKTTDPPRYELEHWPKHLRAAEAAGYNRKGDKDFKRRWNSLLLEVERFMSPENKAYKSWLKLSSTSQDNGRGDSPLHTASRHGVVALIDKYLTSGNAKTFNKNSDTPLHLVCQGGGDFFGLDLLISHSEINARNKDGATPLLLAVKNVGNDVSPIKKLLGAGADPTIRDKSGTTCLHLAAAAHNMDVCECLLNADKETPKVEVDATDDNGETPLHWACKWPNAPVQLIKVLLKHGADLNAQDAESQAPLYEACNVGNDDVAVFLLSKGADINDDDTKKDTALHAAIYAGNLGLVKKLVEHNSDELIKAMNDAGIKSTKSMSEYREVARKAAKKVNAADVFRTNGAKQEAVACAAAHKEYEIMSYLLETHEKRGSILKFLLQTDRKGLTPLHHCITFDEHTSARRLLELGERKLDDGRHSSDNNKNKPRTLAKAMCETGTSKFSPLHTAATRGNYQLVKLLMEHEAPISAHSSEPCTYGPTPLDAAFSSWQAWSYIKKEQTKAFEDIISDLFRSGGSELAGPALKLNCVIERGSTRLFKLFKEWHTHKDEYSWTPKIVAMQYGFETTAGAGTEQSSKTRPPTKWSKAHKDERLVVSDDGLEVSYTSEDPSKKVRMSVRANNPVQPGKKHFYFEVEILGSKNTKPIVGIGFCTRLALLRNALPGWRYARALTWGYQGDSGKKYAKSHQGESYSGKFGAGDTVGCGLVIGDKGPAHGTIYFTRNGKPLGNAFTGTVKGQLFPVLGIDGRDEKVKTRVNFGNDKDRPFKYAKMNGAEG